MSSTRSNNRTRAEQAILEAALQLVEHRDHKGLRLTDIAKMAGVSRQAIYLSFGSRAGLFVELVRFADEQRGLVDRMAHVHDAKTAVERLDRFLDVWANYVPEIAGVAHVVLAMRDEDDAAAAAWNDRMTALHQLCESTILHLAHEGCLAPSWNVADAADVLWTLISIQVWEQLRLDRRWSQKRYAGRLKETVRNLFVRDLTDVQ